MSEPGLVFYVHQAESLHKFHEEIGLLVVQCRAAETSNGLRTLAAQSAFANGMARVALYVDHLACERRDNLAAADTAERADCRGVCSAAGFERRNCRGAARLR